MKKILILLLSALMLGGCAKKTPELAHRQAISVIEGEDELICEEYSRFTGAFPEDGSGRPVTDVAAIKVTNASSKFLDYALIQCDIGEDRVGKFKVTGLPAGKSAWVLEQDAMTITEGERFQARTCTDYAFRPDAITQTDRLSVTVEGNNVTVMNRSGQTLENVCIYYKVCHNDGNYFGGFTPMLNFGTLPPGQGTRKQSAYFGEGAEIVRFSFQVVE